MFKGMDQRAVHRIMGCSTGSLSCLGLCGNYEFGTSDYLQNWVYSLLHAWKCLKTVLLEHCCSETVWSGQFMCSFPQQSSIVSTWRLAMFSKVVPMHMLCYSGSFIPAEKTRAPFLEFSTSRNPPDMSLFHIWWIVCQPPFFMLVIFSTHAQPQSDASFLLFLQPFVMKCAFDFWLLLTSLKVGTLSYVCALLGQRCPVYA